MKIRIPYSEKGLDVTTYRNNGHRVERERNETYELTELGKDKANDYAATGAQLRVLLCLSGGPKSISEITARTGLENDRVVEILTDFATLQWIRRRAG